MSKSKTSDNQYIVCYTGR